MSEHSELLKQARKWADDANYDLVSGVRRALATLANIVEANDERAASQGGPLSE